MRICLLGPPLVDGDGALAPRDRVVLGVLAVRRGQVVMPDQVADAVWGERPPPSWPTQVQICVGRLRKVLGAAAIETVAGGYRLTVSGDEVDLDRFEQLVARGRSLAATGEPERAATAFVRALGLWRGRPFEDLDGWEPGCNEAARLEELRRSVEEELSDAQLTAGEHRDVAAAAEALVAAEPLRERRWAVLALAQYRCGRQADALRTLARARRLLVEQLGIDPGPELVELEAAILRQDASLAAPEPPTSVATECPYKGLAAYDVADADVFFGRDGEVAACLDRLRSSGLLVVAGPSGCGKSSLVRAGLIPALQRQGRSAVVFVPGVDPDTAMTGMLASVERAPVVVVDQFEELFTVGVDSDTARGFCRRLAGYASDRAPVVVCVRADHLAGLSIDVGFARLAEQGLHLVSPLAGDGLRAAIEQPAAQAGLRLEAGLVDLLERDTEGEPGALPMLSHALAETWRRRDGHVLTVDGYRATGGIRAAVARSADRLYDSLPIEQRAMLRGVLLRLVTPSVDGDPMRCRVAIATLVGDRQREQVVALLVQARLVTAEADTVELAHEALARAWPRLQSWLDDDASGQRILRHLAGAATGWDSLGRPGSELYRGARLDTAIEWQAISHPDLTELETAFLDASQAHATSEHAAVAARARRDARQNRRLRRALTAVAVLLVAALVGGLIAYQQRQTAQRNERVAQREQRDAALTALTSSAAALRSNRLDLAALLAVEAYRMAPSAATRSALFGTFTTSPGLMRIVHTDLEVTGVNVDVSVLADTDVMVVQDGFGGADVINLTSGARTHLEGPVEEPGYAWFFVSADGRYAASIWNPYTAAENDADNYGVFTAWDLGSGAQRFEPVRFPFAPARMAISDDGSMVAASAGRSGAVRVYDGTNGKPLTNVDALARPERFDGVDSTAPLAFLPNGNLVIGSMAGPLRIVNPTDGTEVDRIQSPPLTTNNFLWLSRDGTHAVTLGHSSWEGNWDTPISTFDLEAGRRMNPEPTPMQTNCNQYRYAEQIGAILCATWGGRVLALDVTTGAEIDRVLDPQQGPVCGLAVTPDATRLIELTSCLDRAAAFAEWRLDGGGPVSHLVVDTPAPEPSYIGGFGYRGDDSALIVEFATPGDEQPVTHVIDTDSGRVLEQVPGVYGLFPTAEPEVAIAIFDEDGTIGRFDLARREGVGPSIDPGFEIQGVWTSGTRVFLKGPGDDGRFQLRGFDLDSGAPVGPIVNVDEGWDVADVVIVDDVMYIVEWDLDGASSLATPLRARWSVTLSTTTATSLRTVRSQSPVL